MSTSLSSKFSLYRGGLVICLFYFHHSISESLTSLYVKIQGFANVTIGMLLIGSDSDFALVEGYIYVYIFILKINKCFLLLYLLYPMLIT